MPSINFEKFVKHRPEESKNSDSPFFLAMIPVEKIIPNGVWYYNRPLGKNLGKFMSEAKNVLGESGKSKSKIANHSARKTFISSLLDQNIHPIHVSQLSGHKSIESLESYHSSSREQQELMSDIISNHVETNKKPMSAFPTISSTIQCMKRKSIEMQQFDTMFSGANISDCNFNFNINVSLPKAKRSRVIYDSESELDE